MITFKDHEYTARATVETSATVSDAPELFYTGASLIPDHIHVLYLFDADRQRWTGCTTVSGYRVLMNGEVGRTRVRKSFHDGQDVPEWVAQFVRAHRPAALTHIPVPGAERAVS